MNFNQVWYSVNYTTPFPTATLNLQISIRMNAVVSGAISPAMRNISRTGFQVVGDHVQDTSSGDMHWMAIGY
ncbi:MAG: hypothetical protein PF450_13765 [Bacteroidales bacterium]|jgi:hypothetical protein|nr:hypothetical protein [Bacteroidales bacterium]